MIINRNYEERYYSEYDMDSIYEKAFSEGYEYAQREFAKGEKSSKKKKKMRFTDKSDLYLYNHMTPGELVDERARIDNQITDEGTNNYNKIAKVQGRRSLIYGTAGGAIGGAITSTALGHKTSKGALAGAAIGAGIGAAGSISSHIGHKYGNRFKKKYLEENKKYAESWDRQRDLLDVAEGKMSKDDFIEKHGK